MVQILPPNYRRGVGEQLASAGETAIPAIQQFLSEQKQKMATRNIGLPESLVDLPPEGRALAFKQAFTPGKQETALQAAQRKLAEERLNALQSNQGLFGKIFGNPMQEGMQGQAAGEQGQSLEMPQQGQFDISKIPDQELRKAASFSGQPGDYGTLGNLAQSELDRREKEEKEKKQSFQEERKYHSSYSKKLEEEADQLRNSIPKKEMALNFARDAVESGEVGFFSLDRLANALGEKGDIFRTAKGAQLITAGKENLLSNMSRVSAKAQNQWFEQRLNSMFPKIGQSKEANLTVQEMLEGETALDKAYLNEFDRLSAQDEEKYKFVKKDISKRARDAIKPLEKEILKRTTYRMKEIEEQEKGLSSLKSQVGKNVSKGTPLTLAMAKLYKSKFGENALNVAEKNGYYIPTVEEFKIFQERPEQFREGLGE